MSSSIDSRDIFLRGKTVILRALSRTDALDSEWYGWFNDAQVCELLQQHYFPNTAEAQVAFWQQQVDGSVTKLQLGICKGEDPALAGIVSLNHIDYINSKAEFSIVIGRKDARDVGAFIEVCQLVFAHAFDTLNLHRVYGGSLSRELVQLMVRTLGCKEEGVLRQDVFKNGEYRDLYRYGLLRSEFRKPQ